MKLFDSDKTKELIENAKKVAKDVASDENIESLKNSLKNVVDAGSDAVKRAGETISEKTKEIYPASNGASKSIRESNSESKRMKAYIASCPNCGANLDGYDGLDTFYCKYCGTKIVLENQSDAMLDAKKTKMKIEHKEAVADKVLKQINSRAEQKKAEKKRKEEERKRQNKILIPAALGFFILIMGFAFFMDSRHEKKDAAEDASLQAIYEEIQQDVANREYDSALLKANQLYFDTDKPVGNETKKKWDKTRESVIDQIKELQEAEFIDERNTSLKPFNEYAAWSTKEELYYVDGSSSILYISEIVSKKTTRENHCIVYGDLVNGLYTDKYSNNYFKYTDSSKSKIGYYCNDELSEIYDVDSPGFIYQHISIRFSDDKSVSISAPPEEEVEILEADYNKALNMSLTDGILVFDVKGTITDFEKYNEFSVKDEDGYTWNVSFSSNWKYDLSKYLNTQCEVCSSCYMTEEGTPQLSLLMQRDYIVFCDGKKLTFGIREDTFPPVT